jgi:hypothetical protein
MSSKGIERAEHDAFAARRGRERAPPERECDVALEWMHEAHRATGRDRLDQQVRERGFVRIVERADDHRAGRIDRR